MDENNTTQENENVEILAQEVEQLLDSETEETIESSEENADVEGDEEFKLELDYADPEQQEDKLWQARTGLNAETLCGAIETIIFMSDRPVSLIKLKKLIDPDMPLRVLHESIERLQEEYEQKHHGIRLLEVAEGYQFRTKATYSKFVQDLFKVNSLVLTPSALEVLAIIAYKQPVSKIEIEKIRGVDSSHIVRGLMDKRLVKVNGRSDEVGRPVLYGTTPEFLEVFNLADVSQLPPEHELEEIANKNEIGAISDIKTICAGDKERFKFDEIEELDQLSDSIKSIASDTAFTKSLGVEAKKRLSESGGEAKSAFDLLEEYLSTQQVSDSNKDAGSSEMISAFNDPSIVKDLSAGPFNLPDLEEDFEMIDLDSGKTLSELEEEDDDVLKGEDLLNENVEEEAKALSEALDEAFERLTGENLEELANEETSVPDGVLVDKESEIEELTNKIVEKGAELDMDLNFLKDDSDQNSNLD